MDPKVKTILNVLLGALFVVSIVIVIVFFVGTTLFETDAEFSEQISVLGWRLDLFINWAVILAIATAAISLIFPIITMITNPKNSIKTFAVIVGMVVVAVIGYVIASDEILKFVGYEEFFYAESVEDPNAFSKNVGAILWTTYILGGGSILAIVYNEVAKFFK